MVRSRSHSFWPCSGRGVLFKGWVMLVAAHDLCRGWLYITLSAQRSPKWRHVIKYFESVMIHWLTMRQSWMVLAAVKLDRLGGEGEQNSRNAQSSPIEVIAGNRPVTVCQAGTPGIGQIYREVMETEGGIRICHLAWFAWQCSVSQTFLLCALPNCQPYCDTTQSPSPHSEMTKVHVTVACQYSVDADVLPSVRLSCWNLSEGSCQQ